MRVLKVICIETGWSAGMMRERMVKHSDYPNAKPALRFNDGFFCVVSFN